MLFLKNILFFLTVPLLNNAEIFEIAIKLNKVADFALTHYKEINFDGLLGIVIAEAQLMQISSYPNLLMKCKKLREKIEPLLPHSPKKMITLEKSLLHPERWIVNKTFVKNSLKNLRIFQNWTVDDIIRNKHASYKGVPSDFCLMEILAKNCYISSFCQEMMLAPRIDNGYLLTHRLFYLQIVRLKRCNFNKQKFETLTKIYCSWILREAKTNERLGFPAHDIFLEQVVFCGIEGYAEFFTKEWKNRILSWQTPYGCYKSEDASNTKRSSNIISYGCTDHSTGLGAAALALNLKFEIGHHE